MRVITETRGDRQSISVFSVSQWARAEKKMEILVTGATGFTGSYVVPLLLRQGHSVRCLVRSSSDKSVLSGYSVQWVNGDLADFQALKHALAGVDALVNVASLGFGHAPVIVRAAVVSGVRRVVFFSTTAIFTSLNAPSKAERIKAEKTIRGSGLSYTILRPTMIYGSSRDRNMCHLIRFLRKWPFIPVFGSGEYLQQPVYVGDVAQAVADCISADISVNKSYNIPGGNALTFIEVIDTICRLMKRKVAKIHFPASPMVSLLKFCEVHGRILPIKAEQIQRLNEDKAFGSEEARADFGYSPLTFQEGIAIELQELGLL